MTVKKVARAGKGTMRARNLISGSAAALCVLLSACATPDPATLLAGASGQSVSEYLAGIQPQANPSLIDAHVRDGIAAIDGRDYGAATGKFGRALKLDPGNSTLHFLNGLAYHLRAQSGDTRHLSYAKVGYELALKFDVGNYRAAYQLGRLHYRERRYEKAQDAFAYALLYKPDNIEILTGVAVASYHARDLKTALQAAKKLQTLAPGNAPAARAGAMVAAAVGDFDWAERDMKTYVGLTQGSGFRARHLERRIGEWRRFHDRGRIQLAQSDTTEGLSVGSDDDSGGGDSDGGGDDSSKARSKRMCLIDVVIIRSEELMTSRRGVNLLSGLRMQFTGTLFDYNYQNTDSTDPAKHGRTTTTTFNPQLTLPEINYNLNIFNDSTDRNEIIARPTLVALDGKPSKFFSGAVWHVEIAGVSGSEGSVEEIPIGVKLSVQPLFLDNDTVQLNVTAARSFVEDRSNQPSFSNFGQTTKTTVTANVTLPFGKTLVLSGLSEKETSSVRDGVPILERIPILQYFFSQKDKLALNKSVLILLTPRRPQYSYGEGAPAPSDKRTKRGKKTPPANVRELGKRGYWNFTPAPNLDAVTHNLKDSRFFQEFRKGDVTLERWDGAGSLGLMLRRALEVLYF